MNRVQPLLVLLVASLSGCAPHIVGNWNASGHTGEGNTFDLHLAFHTHENGMGIYAARGESGRAVPLCKLTVIQDKLTFTLDTDGEATCSAARRPLRFEGRVGEEVLIGYIYNGNGGKVGLWRAVREAEALPQPIP